MLFNDRLIHTARLGEWDAQFFESGGTDGTYLCTSIELSLDGVKRGRLSLVRPNATAKEAVEQLMERATKWIADYNKRHNA